MAVISDTTGWRASCDCNAAISVPCVVFDPFAGAGTTALVALQHGREFVGIELNSKYIRLAEQRLLDAGLLKRRAKAA
jgi:hypothetical protein